MPGGLRTPVPELEAFVVARRGGGRALGAVSAHPKHEWWDAAVSFLEVPHRHLQGHGQVTDAWLAELSRRRGGRVATLDAGFALLHDDVATLLPRGDS